MSTRGNRTGARRRRPLLRFSLLLVALAGLGLAASARLIRPVGWQEIAPGLAYRRLPIATAEAHNPATLHILRLDLRRYRLRVVSAGNGATATAREFTRRDGALAVVNGGFFDEMFRPLGLRVSGGKELRPLRRVDWGVFFVRGGRPGIVHTRNYRPAGVTEAIQCGPRLVVDGQVTRLKKQSARRTCVGIDGHGRVLLAVTEGADVDATVLARALGTAETKGGLGCRDALNLDGGPSTQLYAAMQGFHLDLPGTWGVPDGLGVFRR